MGAQAQLRVEGVDIVFLNEFWIPETCIMLEKLYGAL